VKQDIEIVTPIKNKNNVLSIILALIIAILAQIPRITR
jgi:hypothetical protein